jgi:hypothetical protein
MLRNLLFVSFVFVFSINIFTQNIEPKVSGLPADIVKWVGEDASKLLENEIISDRLKALLGEKDQATFVEYLEVSNPIVKDGNFLFASGCMIHACTHLESAIAIDLVNNTIHAAIFNEIEDTKYFNERNTKSPRSIISWASDLKTSKTAADQAKAVLFDEFRYGNSEDLMARFDSFTIELQNRPNDIGYIITNGNKRARRNVEKEIKDYSKLRGLDPKRLVFLNGYGDSKVLIRLWTVPEGAKPPNTENE